MITIYFLFQIFGQEISESNWTQRRGLQIKISFIYTFLSFFYNKHQKLLYIFPIHLDQKRTKRYGKQFWLLYLLNFKLKFSFVMYPVILCLILAILLMILFMYIFGRCSFINLFRLTFSNFHFLSMPQLSNRGIYFIYVHFWTDWIFKYNLVI